MEKELPPKPLAPSYPLNEASGMYPNPYAVNAQSTSLSISRQPPPMYETVVQQGFQPGNHQQRYGPPQQIQAIIMIAPHLGKDPATITCQSCHQQIISRVNHEVTTTTHLFAGILCLLGCWPCCLLPYCMNSCRNSNHYCPNCNSFIGTHKP